MSQSIFPAQRQRARKCCTVNKKHKVSETTTLTGNPSRTCPMLLFYQNSSLQRRGIHRGIHRAISAIVPLQIMQEYPPNPHKASPNSVTIIASTCITRLTFISSHKQLFEHSGTFLLGNCLLAE